MGQATRNIANSFTTSGVITSSAVNNSSLGNITDLALGGSLILLSEATASASSSISFTYGIDSTYDEYWFIFNNCHPATDTATFTFQGSTDGGSNYNTTMTTTIFEALHFENDTMAQLGYLTSYDQAQGTSYQTITSAQGNGADESLSGILKLYNPSSTTYVKHFLIRSNNYYYTNGSFDRYIAGYFNTTSAIDAIDFKFTSGNIDDGTIQMFGVK